MKGDPTPRGADHGAAGLVGTDPEATADPGVVSAGTELEPAGAGCSDFQRKSLRLL